jgi:hypothetical protein
MTGAVSSGEAQAAAARGALRFERITPGTWEAPSTYRAQYDGFVLAYVSYPSSATKSSLGTGYATVRDTWAYVTGGNMGYFGPAWAYYMTNDPQSLLLPVAAGETVRLAYDPISGMQTNPPYAFYYASLGTTRAAAINDDTPEAPFVPPPRPQPRDDTAVRRRVEEFVDSLERMIGTPIEASKRDRLLALGPMV